MKQRVNPTVYKDRMMKILNLFNEQRKENGFVTKVDPICKANKMGGDSTKPFKDLLIDKGVIKKIGHGVYQYYPDNLQINKLAFDFHKLRHPPKAKKPLNVSAPKQQEENQTTFVPDNTEIIQKLDTVIELLTEIKNKKRKRIFG